MKILTDLRLFGGICAACPHIHRLLTLTWIFIALSFLFDFCLRLSRKADLKAWQRRFYWQFSPISEFNAKLLQHRTSFGGASKEKDRKSRWDSSCCVMSRAFHRKNFLPLLFISQNIYFLLRTVRCNLFVTKLLIKHSDPYLISF